VKFHHHWLLVPLFILIPAWWCVSLVAQDGSQPAPAPAASKPDSAAKPAKAGDDEPGADEASAVSEETKAALRHQGLLAGITIFVLAIFVGFEIITKVPPTLHTPLMSGSNAISGITLVGAVIVAGSGFSFGPVVAAFAVLLATVNVVGGFLVTHRMLAKFSR